MVGLFLVFCLWGLSSLVYPLYTLRLFCLFLMHSMLTYQKKKSKSLQKSLNLSLKNWSWISRFRLIRQHTRIVVLNHSSNPLLTWVIQRINIKVQLEYTCWTRSPLNSHIQDGHRCFQSTCTPPRWTHKFPI